MSDTQATDATDITLSYGAEAQGSIALDQVWADWLQGTDPPANVSGIDPGHDDLGGAGAGYA